MEPEYVLQDIEEQKHKDKFKEIFDDLGYEWQEYEEYDEGEDEEDF